MFSLTLLLLILLLSQATANPSRKKLKLTVGFISSLVMNAPTMIGLKEQEEVFDYGGHNTPHIPRKRRPVKSIFQELGPLYVRRAYRMSEDDFWTLLSILHPHLTKPRKATSKKKHKDGAVNGMISTATRLSVALRYFAGGSSYDIAIAHGISHSSVFESVWRVVDAVNACGHESLSVSFPTSHEKQKHIARGFKLRSDVDFDCCAGAIDGMLLWTEMPWEKDCETAKCEPKRFYCGRKKKFGLNLQGICDNYRRFIDVAVSNPASTSDYLSFCTSDIHQKLEQDGFLAEELCLFGDNA